MHGAVFNGSWVMISDRQSGSRGLIEMHNRLDLVRNQVVRVGVAGDSLFDDGSWTIDPGSALVMVNVAPVVRGCVNPIHCCATHTCGRVGWMSANRSCTWYRDD